MAYAGRLAIIVGGLGGIGSAVGQLLRSKGASIAVLYAPFEASRRDSILKDVYGSSAPERVTAYECDITSETAVKHAFDELSQSSAGFKVTPNMLINTAGYVTVQPFESTSVEEAQRNFTTNLLGPFIVSKAFFGLYTSGTTALGSKAPPGRIVSISSQAAHVALDGHGPYCASKAGLLGLTRCMASEWGGRGITANTVSPTVVWTTLGKKAWANDEKRERHLAQIPTGRFSLPEEIASAIEFLCRDESGMINGADLRVDGGFTIAR